MVDDASVDSEFSYLTGDSEGQSTVALSNVQLAVMSEPSTVVPQPKAPVPPNETAITVVPSPANPLVVTVLPKQVRIPIVPSTVQLTVATKDIPSEPQEVGPAVPASISAPAVTIPTTQPPHLPGTPTSYVTTSMVTGLK
jgi:hypothetical protein